MSRIWAGIDSGKTHHQGLVIDTDGKKLLSRRVLNDESELLELLADVLALADGDPVTWAVDMTGGEPALLIALLFNHGQEILYTPGKTVNRASDGYRSEGKTDARDAYVIADQARIRRDLTPVRPGDETAVELGLLTGRRTDLVRDRTRAVNRLRSTLTGMFPSLERALEVTNTGPLVLLTGYQTPAALRRLGRAQLTRWLQARGVRGAEALAEAAVSAAERQHTAVPGESVIADMVKTLALEVIAFNEKVAEIDTRVATRFRRHALAEVILSMPGIGPLLGAEFLAATGGDLSGFASPDRLAAFSGLPCPRPARPREGQRQPASAPLLPSAAPARLLSVRHDQRQLRPQLPCFLRKKAERGKEPRSGGPCSRPSTSQRFVGPYP